jgi:hypothetical protein
MGTLQRYMGVIDGVKRGEPKNIVVTFDKNVLIGTEYTYSDITDISMNLKVNPYTDADDAYLQKKQSQIVGGNAQVVLDQANNRFIMVIKENDYDNLDWKTYYICINVDVGLDKMIEIERKGVLNRTVEIVKDTNRE